MTPKELANKLLDFYQNDPKRWTKHYYARDKDGKSLDLGTSPDAVCWCLVGACQALGVDDFELYRAFGSVARLNDEAESFDEIKVYLGRLAQ